MDTITAGMRIMGELMGDGYLARRAQQRNAFNGVLQDCSAEVCFDRVRARPGLDRKLRSAINITMLAALNRPGQLRHHVEGALNNGCSAGKIQEILLQAAVCRGLPAAGEGFRISVEEGR